MLATKSTSGSTSPKATSSVSATVSLAKSAPKAKAAQNASVKASPSKTTQTQVKAPSTSPQELKKAVNKEISTKEIPTTSVSAQPITENVKLLEAGPKPVIKSAGAIIRECFIAALSSGLIDDKAMEILTSAEKTNEVLKIRYAFLLEVKTGTKEERMVKGNARYTAKPIVEYKDKKYYITNDLYTRNIMVFQDWIEVLRKEWKERLSKIKPTEKASSEKTLSKKTSSKKSSETTSKKTSSKK